MIDFIAEKVSIKPLKDLIPYARNSRKHSNAQIDQIAASMREWGWTNPVLVDENNTILAGHGRVMAAQKLGIENCPVIIAAGWSDDKKRAYVIADNKISENSSWDEDLLKIEIDDLGGFDVSLLGFSDKEITQLLQNAQSVDGEDDVPEISDRVASSMGQVWLMGNHKIMCGDSTNADDVRRLLSNVRPTLMVTDPPYGVKYDASWRNILNGSSDIASGKVLNDEQADWSAAYRLFEGDVGYIWHSSSFQHVVYKGIIESGFEVRANIVWVKNSFAISRGHYHYQHEPCFYICRKGKSANWMGDRKQSTVWNIDKNKKSETGHSTQKPVECMRRPIVNNSSPGQVVYEPFSGSGTTIIAAELTGRSCYAIELNPDYVDVAVKRWQTLTGGEAVDSITGVSFNDLLSKK